MPKLSVTAEADGPVIYGVNADGEINVMHMKWKTPYNHDTMDESLKSGTACHDKSLAQQSQEEEANINTIVKRFGVTGQLPQIPMPPTIDDFTEVFDFQSSMNLVLQAKRSFEQLPAEVRTMFQNDPHRFVNYVDAAVEANDLDQLRRWGLAVPLPEGQGVVPPATPPTAPEAPKPAAEPPKT